MKKHISYPKIGQFRNIVANIKRGVSFVGLDNDGEAVYDHSIKMPKLTFNGTVKLHGTNASVCFNSKDGFWIQSRKNIITVEKDNAGFAFFAESKKEIFIELLENVVDYHNLDTNEFTISLYGEWAGKGIQKGVAISKLEKSFFIFGVKVSNPQDEEFNSYWLNCEGLSSPDDRIYNVNDFKTFSVDVDLNMAQLVQNELVRITEEVERECPISSYFGVKGTGEGVVWTTQYKDTVHRFKTKGDKHSVTKVKKLGNVDVEKLKSITEFIEYSVTLPRFEQAIKETNPELKKEKLGEVIRWMINDIINEEMDTLVKNNLEPNDINKYVATKTKEMFFIIIW